jgi:hypothetical protein
LATEGLAAIDAGTLDEVAVLAGEAAGLVWDQPEDVVGVSLGGGHVVRAHAGRQPFATLGWATVFLARAFEALGDDALLEAAIELHDLTAALGDDVWAWPEHAAVGLGAAVLHQVTGEQAFLATAERIADMLCETQSADGSWGGDALLTAEAAQVLAESADAVESREGLDPEPESESESESETQPESESGR